jgi:iron complex outermembrane recepter protein|uniref:TonB-dependent siderophore receptor n=1 Tax=Cephaloticoccus sp. TaxID=1985742 RepID=UPI00404B02C4
MYLVLQHLRERYSVKRFSFAIIASLLATTAFAQTAPMSKDATDEVITLDVFQVNTTADKGYRAGNSVSATRIDTSIKDLPFSISAFTEQFIEDIGANELLDVVKFAPGVTSGAKEFTQGNNRYSIRGFDGDVTPQRNGFVGARYVDSGNIDRVEVVKGPASLLYGQITPGGSVNYITKRPKGKSYVKVKAQFGTDNYRRADVDVNEVVGDGRYKFRLIGAYEKALAWADPSGGDSRLVAGSFEAKLTDTSTLIVDFESYNKAQEPNINMLPNMSVSVSASASNFPVVADRARAQAYIDVGNLNLGFIGYAPVPRDFNYPSQNDYRRSRFDSINLEFNQKIGDNWRARMNFGYNEFKISNKLTGLAEFTTTPSTAYLATHNRFDYVALLAANPAAVLADANLTKSSLLTRRKRLEESSGDNLAWQAEITGVIETGGMKIRPLFGAFLNKIGSGSFRRQSRLTPSATTPNEATDPLQHYQPWNYNDRSTWVNTTDFNPDDIPNVDSYNDASGEDSAVYALANISLMDERLILIGGARYNKTWTINTDKRNTVTGGAASVGSKFEATKTTPQFGAGFKVRPDLLLFTSYSESFFIESRSITSWNPSYNPLLPTSSTNRVTISEPAKPTTGSGYEVGLKTDFMEGRVSSTVSLFHLERENRVLRFRESAPDGSFPTLTRQGTVDQSEGVEVEVTWSPSDNWQVYASVTKMDVKTTKAVFPALPTNADPIYQAAYEAAFNEAKALMLNAVPEGTAEELATLWTRYNFTGDMLQGYWIGGGFVYTGDKAQRTANPTLFLEAHTTYDLTIGRDWKMNGQSWSANLAVKNLADVEYFNANQSRGTPRRLTLSVSTKF